MISLRQLGNGIVITNIQNADCDGAIDKNIYVHNYNPSRAKESMKTKRLLKYPKIISNKTREFESRWTHEYENVQIWV